MYNVLYHIHMLYLSLCPRPFGYCAEYMTNRVYEHFIIPIVVRGRGLIPIVVRGRGLIPIVIRGWGLILIVVRGRGLPHCGKRAGPHPLRGAGLGMRLNLHCGLRTRSLFVLQDKVISFLDGLSDDALKKEATTEAKSDTFSSIMKVCVCVCVCVCPYEKCVLHVHIYYPQGRGAVVCI